MKSLDKSLTKETLKFYWNFSKPEWRLASVALLALVFNAVVQAYQPYLYKHLLDIVVVGSRNDTVTRAVWTIVLIGITSSVIVLVRRVQDWAAIQFQPNVKANILAYCYKYLQEHSVNFFNNSFAGSLVRRVNKYERSYEELSDQLIFNIGQSMIRICIIIGALSFRSWKLSAVVLVWVLAYIAINYATARIKMKYDLLAAEQDSIVTGFLSDTIGNELNIKLFTGLRGERQEFGKLVAEQMKRLRTAWRVALRSDLVQGLLMVILEVAVMSVAFTLWRRGALTIGDFALAQGYLTQINGRLWDFGRNIRRIYQSLADANEMTEILLTPHEVVDAPIARKLRTDRGAIVFKNVTFGYGNHNKIFSNFSLDIRPGERVALVGSSGGGKSTIVKLILRFFDIQEGEIAIDGQNIAQVTQDSLRGAVSLVPQEPILFHRTLMENIRYARPKATDAEVVKAARLAHCHEFISSFKDGYHTLVGERGVKLSGGERQRVAIARAILKDAPILVLDEATSSLDSESEMLIQDAMKNLMAGKTVIVIAHRLSTIMQMDRIVVLDGGKVIEQGKHEELVKARQGTYQKLWGIQAGGFV